jgi:hypothetical protein
MIAAVSQKPDFERISKFGYDNRKSSTVPRPQNLPSVDAFDQPF